MILDLIILLVVASTTIWGFRRGLVKSLMFFPSLFSSIVAWIIYPKLSGVILSTSLFKVVSKSIESNYVLPHIADIQSNNWAGLGIFAFLLDSNIVSSFTDGLASFLSASIATLVVHIASLFIAFVLCRMLFRLALFVLSTIASIPIFKQINQVGGALLGFVKSMLLIYLVFTLFTLFIPLRDPKIVKIVEKSKIVAMMEKNNVIVRMFTHK